MMNQVASQTEIGKIFSEQSPCSASRLSRPADTLSGALSHGQDPQPNTCPRECGTRSAPKSNELLVLIGEQGPKDGGTTMGRLMAGRLFTIVVSTCLVVWAETHGAAACMGPHTRVFPICEIDAPRADERTTLIYANGGKALSSATLGSDSIVTEVVDVEIEPAVKTDLEALKKLSYHSCMSVYGACELSAYFDIPKADRMELAGPRRRIAIP